MIPRNKTYPGLFIAIEGPDGAGKTTAMKKLKNYFDKRPYLSVTETRMVGGNKFCEEIREKLIHGRITDIDRRISLVADAFENNYKNIILPKRKKQNAVIISDRWYYSTLVYQGMHPNGFRHAPDLAGFKKVCKELINRFELDSFVGKPNILIVLSPGAKVTFKRCTEDRTDGDPMDSKTLSEHEVMRDAYAYATNRDNLGLIGPDMIITAADIDTVLDLFEFRAAVTSFFGYWNH